MLNKTSFMPMCATTKRADLRGLPTSTTLFCNPLCFFYIIFSHGIMHVFASCPCLPQQTQLRPSFSLPPYLLQFIFCVLYENAYRHVTTLQSTISARIYKTIYNLYHTKCMFKSLSPFYNLERE